MSFEFPFAYVKVSGLGLLFYPIVRLQLKTVVGWREFEFLVDTGADVTTLPLAILPLLGVDFKKLPRSSTFGVGGIKVAVRETAVPVKLGEDGFRVQTAVTEGDGGILLLGKKDVFEERFSLILDSKRKVTVLKKN